MSALPLALARDERDRPPIEVAPTRAQRKRRPRLVYAIVSVAGIAVILLAQLLLSMLLSQGAYTISSLQTQQKEYARDVDDLTEQQQLHSSTQYLAASASALGMVSNTHRVFLRLSDGAVLGTPQAASASDGGIVDPTGDLVANAVAPKVPASIAASAGQDGAGTTATGQGGAAPSGAATGGSTQGGSAQGDAAQGDSSSAPTGPSALDGTAGTDAAGSATGGDVLPSPVTH